MYNLNNKNLFSDDLLNPNKNNNYYYDFGTDKKKEREEVKKTRDAFLEGFDFPETVIEREREKREQERKEGLAKIRANAEKREWSSQSTIDPFLEEFSLGSTAENKRMFDTFKEKTSISKPRLSYDTDRTFRGLQFDDALKPTVQKHDSAPTITKAINRNPNAKNEYKPIGTHNPNEELVMTRFSNDKKPTVRIENGDYAAAQRKAKEEQYEKKVSENAQMNGKPVWKTRKATDIIVENSEFIKAAAKRHGVNPAILAACIYAEQANNVTITEELEDMTQSFLGMDCSVGSGQVRISTAKKVEDAGYMPKTYDSEAINYAFTNPFTGEAVYWSDTFSRDKEIYRKLKDPETNINYVAAYLAMIQNMWKEEYPVISGDTAILATLYNIGENGGEKGINKSPTSNDFGDFAKANYPYMQYLLGLE